jgi:hypothetical protein
MKDLNDVQKGMCVFPYSAHRCHHILTNRLINTAQSDQFMTTQRRHTQVRSKRQNLIDFNERVSTVFAVRVPFVSVGC